MQNETDETHKEKARKAAEKGNDTKFLDDAGLEDDLIEVDADSDDEDGEGIINSEHPENEEWNVREEQNRH